MRGVNVDESQSRNDDVDYRDKYDYWYENLDLLIHVNVVIQHCPTRSHLNEQNRHPRFREAVKDFTEHVQSNVAFSVIAETPQIHGSEKHRDHLEAA
jgi:hypothetical protein